MITDLGYLDVLRQILTSITIFIHSLSNERKQFS